MLPDRSVASAGESQGHKGSPGGGQTCSISVLRKECWCLVRDATKSEQNEFFTFAAVLTKQQHFSTVRCSTHLLHDALAISTTVENIISAISGPVTEFRCKQKVYWAYPAIPWEIQLKQTNEEHEERMDMLTHDLERLKMERDDCRERVWAMTRGQRMKAAANKQREEEEEVRKRELDAAKQLIEELKKKVDEQKEEVKYLRLVNPFFTEK